MSYPERPLGEVLTQVTDTVKVKAGEVYNTIGIYSYGRGIIRRPAIDGTETSYATFNRLHSGQFVYSKLFGWEGALAVVRPEHEGLYASSEFPTFELDKDQIDFTYLGHLAAWPTLHSALRGNATGMGSRRQRINVAQLLNTRVPLPSVAEQRRVGARLNVMLGKLARAGDLRKSAQASYAALRESLIAHAANPVPRKVGSVMELTRRPVSVELDATYREIGLRSFGKGVFHKAQIGGAALGSKKIFAIEPGDLLFSSVFAWEGAVARASEAERGRVGSHRFMTYVVDEALANPDYLRFLFLSAPGLEVLRRCSPGGAGRNKTLGIKAFEAAQIPLPPLKEQRRIADVLLAAERISRHLNAEYEQRAETFRLSLLDAAFTGKL